MNPRTIGDLCRALVLGTLIACANPGNELPGGTHEFTELARGDTTYATNRGEPLYPGHLRLDEYRELALSGNLQEPSAFVNPSGAGFDTVGNLFVFDSGAHSLLRFDSEFSLSGRVGREGPGPGELTQNALYRLQVFGDGTADLTCRTPKQWLRWSPAGELGFDRKSSTFSNTEDVIFHASRDATRIYGLPFGNTVRRTTPEWRLYEYDAHMTNLRVLHSVPADRHMFVQHLYRGRTMYQTVPYVNEIVFAIRDDIVAVTSGVNPSLVLMSISDGRIRVVQWDDHWDPVDPRAALDTIKEWGWFDRLAEETRRDALESFRSLEFPVMKPTIAKLLLAADGRVWAELWGESGFASNITTDMPEPDLEYDYVLLSSSGELLWRGTLPFRVRAASDRFLVEFHRDYRAGDRVVVYEWSLP